SVIPLDDVVAAVAELKRAAAKGAKGVLIPVRHTRGRPPYRDASYDPFWGAAEDLGQPVNLHISTGQWAPHPNKLPKERLGETPSMLIDLYNEIQLVLADEFIF